MKNSSNWLFKWGVEQDFYCIFWRARYTFVVRWQPLRCPWCRAPLNSGLYRLCFSRSFLFALWVSTRVGREAAQSSDCNYTLSSDFGGGPHTWASEAPTTLQAKDCYFCLTVDLTSEMLCWCEGHRQDSRLAAVRCVRVTHSDYALKALYSILYREVYHRTSG